MRKRALFLLSAETALPRPWLPPFLPWPRCGGHALELALAPCVGPGGQRVNHALPEGFQLTVETLAPSPRPFHCANICASCFFQEETEAQMSVPQWERLQGTLETGFSKEMASPLLLSASCRAAPSPNWGSSIRPGAAVALWPPPLAWGTARQGAGLPNCNRGFG